MRQQMTNRWLALVAVLATLSLTAAAETPQAPTNTVITADHLSFDYNRMVAVFDGNVHAQDPQMLMTSEKLTVFFDETNDVKSVTAIGNVRVYSEDKRAECDKAVYIRRMGRVELTGNARLFRGRDEIRGREITFWLDDERMLVEPGKLILYPGDNKDGPALDLLPSPSPRQAPSGSGTPKQ